jgi:hypothetical protein
MQCSVGVGNVFSGRGASTSYPGRRNDASTAAAAAAAAAAQSTVSWFMMMPTAVDFLM